MSEATSESLKSILENLGPIGRSIGFYPSDTQLLKYIEADGPLGKYTPPTETGTFGGFECEVSIWQGTKDEVIGTDQDGKPIIGPSLLKMVTETDRVTFSKRPDVRDVCLVTIEDEYRKGHWANQVLALWCRWAYAAGDKMPADRWERIKPKSYLAFLEWLRAYDQNKNNESGPRHQGIWMPHEQIAQWYWEQLKPKVNTDPEPCNKPTVQQIADVLKVRYPDQSNTYLANEYSIRLEVSRKNLRNLMSTTDPPTEDAKKWVNWKLG